MSKDNDAVKQAEAVVKKSWEDEERMVDLEPRAAGFLFGFLKGYIDGKKHRFEEGKAPASEGASHEEDMAAVLLPRLLECSMFSVEKIGLKISYREIDTLFDIAIEARDVTESGELYTTLLGLNSAFAESGGVDNVGRRQAVMALMS